jgi:hypothetical protein
MNMIWNYNIHIFVCTTLRRFPSLYICFVHFFRKCLKKVSLYVHVKKGTFNETIIFRSKAPAMEALSYMKCTSTLEILESICSLQMGLPYFTEETWEKLNSSFHDSLTPSEIISRYTAQLLCWNTSLWISSFSSSKYSRTQL